MQSSIRLKTAGKDDGRGYTGETPEEQAKAKHDCEIFMAGILASAETITFMEPKAAKKRKAA